MMCSLCVAERRDRNFAAAEPKEQAERWTLQ